MADVGLSVNQGVANGATPFSPASKHIVAALMDRERGPVGVPMRVTSLQEDRAIFGGVEASKYGAIIIRNMFKNAGRYGVEMYGIRVGSGAEVVATATIVETASDLLVVTAGYKGVEDPGAWGNNLSVTLFPPDVAGGNVSLFQLDVFLSGSFKERFTADSLENLIVVVNEQSGFIALSAGAGIATAFTTAKTVFLAGGSNSTPVANDYEAVLEELEGLDFNILISTEVYTEAHAIALRDFAKNNEAVYVTNLAQNAGVSGAATFSASLKESGPSHIVCYYNWGKTTNESGSFVDVPVYAGVIGSGFIRVPGINADNIAQPPGGVEANLNDFISVSPERISQKDINLLVQQYGVNVVVTKRGYGFFPVSSRTMATNPLYHSIHVLRQTLYYIQTLRNNLLYLTQKPNTPALQSQAYAAIYAFFINEYGLGNLENSVPFDVACEILADRSVNPVGQDRKIFNIVINWIPTEQTESVVIRLNRNDGRLLVEAS